MNDERPIEKLLRRYAQKRRDEAGAPAELHPANRRGLQAEVVRQFPQAQRRAGWWAGVSLLLNRKLAYAVAVVAVIGVGVLLIRPPKNEPMGLAALDAKKAEKAEFKRTVADEEILAPVTTTSEAKDRFTPAPTVAAAPPAVRTESVSLAADSATAATGVNSAAPQPAPLSLSPISRTRSSPASNVEADRSAARRQQVAESVVRYNEQAGSPARSDAFSASAPAKGTPTASPLAPATMNGVTTNAGSAETFARRYGMPPAGPAPATAKSAPSSVTKTESAPTGLAGSPQDNRQKLVQSFSQTPVDGQVTSGRKAGKLTPVLAQFTIEQTGDQIRVTDSDGSTYTGLVQVASQENLAQKDMLARGGGLEKSRQVQTAYDATLSESRSASGEDYLFQVMGVNRTLNQPVNFVGNFVWLTNQATGAVSTAQFADKSKNAPTQQQIRPLLQNSSIKGRLQIGTGRELELNAVPVKP